MQAPLGKDVAAAIGAERGYLVKFASARVRGDAALAEDLAQETLLAALQGAQRFENRAALRTWLTGILLNRIADYARRRRRSPQLVEAAAPADGDDDAGADHGPEAIDWIDPRRVLEGRQLLRAAADALAALSPKAARLFALREVEGLSPEAAAHRVGLEPSAASLLLHRARRRLRAQFEPLLTPV